MLPLQTPWCSEGPCPTQLIGHGRYMHSLREHSLRHHPKARDTVGAKPSIPP